ncbi:YoaK family protein [Naasia lichenicola]|uniref:YoaK family protein n=1 Tax=Naasia lichenicola TaxID=2565933 RepID=UPI002FCDF00A
MRQRLRGNQDRLHLVLMLALTFSTGVVDAVGYLGLDRVFTGNMTGNVVILGMALTGADDLPVVGPIIALVGFVLGAMVGGRVLRTAEKGWTGRATWLLSVVAALIVLALVPILVTSDPYPVAATFTVTGILGAAMGMQAGVARHLGVADVTTVVVTSTLVGLAFDSHLGRRNGQKWVRRLLAVVLIALGALTGAALLQLQLGYGIGLAALITVIVAILGHVGAPRRGAAASA